MNTANLPRASIGAQIALFLCLVVLSVGLAWHALPPHPAFSSEAVIRSGVGSDLLSGLTRGRQGLVGSLYWAPLPTLAALPFLKLPAPFSGPFAFVVVAALAAAFLGVLLNAWFRRNGVTAGVRLAAVLLLLCSPLFREHVLRGDTELLCGLLAVGVICFLLSWWETDQLRSLAYLAVMLMLVMITRYQAVLLFLGASVFVAARLSSRRRQHYYAEATLTVFLVPPVYAASLWLISNWLIMGDALFFLRGVPGGLSSAQAVVEMLAGGWDWKLLLLLGFAAVLPWLAVRWGGGRRATWAGGAAILACVLAWPGAQWDKRGTVNPADMELEAQVAPYLNAAHRGDWVAVSGYRGYEIAQWMPEGGKHRLYHTLSFYPDQAWRNTRGRRLFLLVPEPTGRDRWEDVSLKYPELFPGENAFTVYERTWLHWRLLRVVRMDETDRR